MEYELKLKTIVQERAERIIRDKISMLRKALHQIAESGGKVPSPEESAMAMMNEWKSDQPRDEPVSEATVAFIEDLRRKGRSDRLVHALSDTSLTDISLFMCDMKPADLMELVAALKLNQVLCCLSTHCIGALR